MCSQLTGLHTEIVLPENSAAFLRRTWLDSVALSLAGDYSVTHTLHPVPEGGLLGRAVRTQERVGFLHRCLPHPVQCETPGAEVEAGVAEEELLGTQNEEAVLGPGGCEVLGCLRLCLANTVGVEEQVEGPSQGLPVPV